MGSHPPRQYYCESARQGGETEQIDIAIAAKAIFALQAAMSANKDDRGHGAYCSRGSRTSTDW